MVIYNEAPTWSRVVPVVVPREGPVSVLPRFPDVFVGDDITLLCKGGSGTTKWFINGVKQSHQDSLMLLTAVTSNNSGEYECERGGSKSNKLPINVLELEPHAQLSPSVGGAVMSKGDGRNLVLQVDDDPNGWVCFVLRGENGFKLEPHAQLSPSIGGAVMSKGDGRNLVLQVEDDPNGWVCFVLRGENGFSIQPAVDEKRKRAVIFAELKEAKRATFWCKKGTQRSNAVTLKMTELRVMLEPPAVPALLGESVALRCVVWGGGEVEKAVFYKDNKSIPNEMRDTYIITKATQDQTGKYSCHATYRYSHIRPDAARQEGDSDAQELKVIGGPPAATVIPVSTSSLRCSCKDCSADCRSSYHWYRTHLDDPFARQKFTEKGQDIDMKESGLYSCRMDCGKGFSRFSNVYHHEAQPTPESVNVLPIMAAILMVLGVLIVVLVVLKCRKRGGSSVQTTERDKDKKTGGVYEQIQLTDQADKDKGEGGYEAIQKRQEETVCHTLGPGEGQSQGEGQGGYEALEKVKAEVYQTLSSAESKTPAGESEGGYEQLPQKAKDYEAVTVEENPYEELKAGQQDKKQASKDKEEEKASD
ncbi:hypothetical protein DPX16_4523 [Anabarilius grahami]|uniref:Ig-like domain-containing protein n=1 Tax=Anabarilius grahami TaxID=495550 RepID=A0A3N0XJ92_ANAGA|nr:hypothetical protein DPX16_4523 [Anabarilius grahami]